MLIRVILGHREIEHHRLYFLYYPMVFSFWDRLSLPLLTRNWGMVVGGVVANIFDDQTIRRKDKHNM